MTDDLLCSKFAYGLELDLEEKKKIDNILLEISRLNHVEKLLLYLKLPGETNIFRTKPKRDSLAESISIQWIKTHLKPDPNFSLLKKNVYENYKSFCLSNEHPFVSLNDFGKNLRSTMNTIHHRRLGRRGEALYAYAGVNYTEEAKPFVAPELLECCELSKQMNDNSEGNIDSDCDDSSECDEDSETCRRWRNCVSLSIRNLILEWAEKVIDKSIKFKKYKELAEHLFNHNFINKNSKDAYILLSDMRQSGTNKIMLPKITNSNGMLGSCILKPENGHIMQNQTKQKLYNTLTRRDELRQQKRRVRLEEFSQKGIILDPSKPNNKSRSFSSSGASTVDIKLNATNISLKRPTSAHQKVILPKIARTQDSVFEQGPGLDVSSSSMGQFLFVPSRDNSNVTPLVIALVPGQSAASKNQVLRLYEGSPKDQAKLVGQHLMPHGTNNSSDILNSSLLTLHAGSPELCRKSDKLSDSSFKPLGGNQIKTLPNDNLPAPNVLKKVYKDSRFIASVLSDAASNPFGSAVSTEQLDKKSCTDKCLSSVMKKKTTTIRNKFSNQTVSTLLSRQRTSAHILPKSLTYVKLASDRRPVAKILRDKREKLSITHRISSNIHIPTLHPVHNSVSLTQTGGYCTQIKFANESFPPVSGSCGEKENMVQSNCDDKMKVHLSSKSADCTNEGNTLGSELPREIETETKEIPDNSVVFNEISHSSSINTEHSESLETEASHLFHILDEPLIHSDGSAVFQKSSDPPEIFFWFESQESDTNRELMNEHNKMLNGQKIDKLLFSSAMSTSIKDWPNGNFTPCSPSVYLGGRGSDDLHMPFSNRFARDLTLQQLSNESKLNSKDIEVRNIGDDSNPISLKQSENRPVSVCVISKNKCEDGFMPISCLSRANTVASKIIDDNGRLRTQVINDVSCFTPVQMVESISPGISGVRHPQPLVATVSANGKMNWGVEISKPSELHRNNSSDYDNNGRRYTAGSFVPYTNGSMTSVGLQSKRLSRQKVIDPVDPMLSDESLLVYLSNERQRHSSAHEISLGSINDPWIFNNASEAEIDAILHQGFTSSPGQMLRCHSEPVKYHASLEVSPEDVLIGNDDDVIASDDKVDELQSRDESLEDIGANNLGIYFEEEDINFNLWNTSNE